MLVAPSPFLLQDFLNELSSFPQVSGAGVPMSTSSPKMDLQPLFQDERFFTPTI